jgi:carbon storage regulator
MALVLTRKDGEKIKIGEDIEIIVKGAKKVQLVINAPKSIKVLRGEHYEQMGGGDGGGGSR